MNNEALRPHSFAYDYGGECRWCGATRESVQDALVPIECENHDPVDRSLRESRDGLLGRIRERDDQAAAYEAAAKRLRDEIVILRQHFDALGAEILWRVDRKAG